MNTLQWYLNGLRSIQPPNTFIGGVSASLGTPTLLAAKLGILESRITNFSVVGSDIQCRIMGSYTISFGTFEARTDITSYYDYDGLVTSIGIQAFNICSNINFLWFPNCLSVDTTSLGLIGVYTTIYIPRCTAMGSTSGNNNIFGGTAHPAKLYCPISLQTNNGGSPDGDITVFINLGGTVSYVSNFTAPNPVTTLVAGTIYSTAIQLNFTPPSSTNAIEFYECYADGVFKNKISASGQYIVGLTASTSYTIEVKPRDVFYNESSSNAVVQSTNTASAVPTSGLVSYYKLDEISGTVADDAFGSDDLTNTGVSINQTGKVGTSYKATASIQKLQNTTATAITGNFTLNIWVYVPAAQTIYATPFEIGNYGANTGFGFLFNSDNRISWRVNQSYDHYNQTIDYGVWQMITMVYNGTNVKFYINATLKSTTSYTVNPNTTQLRTAFYRQDQAQQAICSDDEIAIYNTAKTQNEIDILYNLGTGITL